MGDIALSSETLSLATTEGLSASSSGDISVSSVSGVSVSSGDNIVRLSDEGSREYVGYSLKSSWSFDSFEQMFDSQVSNVDELIIVVSESESGSVYDAVAVGPAEISIDIYNGASSSESEWIRVWSVSLGDDTVYSLHGVTAQFAATRVEGIRLVSSTNDMHDTGVFEGCDSLVVQLGSWINSGTVSVSTSGRVEVGASESVSVSSLDISVSSMGSISVS
jgi:hypothetical protein